MNPEHPPLAKLIAAFPLLAFRSAFDSLSQEWENADEYNYGFHFLYGNDADKLLFWARVPMILLAALGGIVTFLWARDMFGPAAGVFAAALYAFCPNLLAHGMLVTTDGALAAFTVLTLYLFWKRGTPPSWQSDAATGIALGAAMASKFSGAFLPIIITVFCLLRRDIRSLLIIGATSLAVIELAYLVSAAPLLYFTNARLVNANHIRNYPFYLFGELKPGGWWYYFLVAFALKATLPVLSSIVFAAVSIRRGFIDRWGESILLVSIVFYFVFVSFGADQIGVRYLLPVFPILFVWVSRIAQEFAARPIGIGVLGLLIAWQAWSSLSAFPNYIPYFNEMAGGATHGPAFLDDSNIDWGQSVKQAADYVRVRNIQNLKIYSFSPFDNPEYYGLPKNLTPSQVRDDLLFKRPAPGTYIISAHYVVRMSQFNPAWKTYRPIGRIGESLLVFKFD